MKFATLPQWKQNALSLLVAGKSYKAIHKELGGVPYDTMYGFLRKHCDTFTQDEIIRNKRLPTIFVIGDTQCKQGIDMEYMSWIGHYIATKRPDIIVHIGDHYDMAALSSYDKGQRSAEGRRVVADLEAGHLGLKLIEDEIKKVKGYNPRRVVTLGNHEDRIDRYVKFNPEFEGLLGTDELLAFERYGWEVFPFLTPCDIEGISFQHYVQNTMTGKPLGGNALNILKQASKSFVMGHKQVLDIALKPVLGGGHQIGIVVGACYEHDESYKGVQGNNHFRGCVMLYEVEDGFALPKPISLKHMRKVYEAR